MSAVTIIARKELLDARSNRWLYLYAAVVALLGVVIAQTGIHSAGAISLQVFGRTTATLINLCLFLAPLVAITLATGSISTERDQGTLEQLLAQPITRSELLIGKYLGLFAALFMATILGFAPAGIIIGMNASFMQSIQFLLYPVLSQLLISVMLSIGLLISVRAKSRAQANAVGIAIWFMCVLAYDIVLLGSLSVVSLPADALAILLLLNPVDSSRILSIITLEPDLYVLGPAGAFLVETFTPAGAAAMILSSLAVWLVAPLWLALRSFSLKKDTVMSSKKPLISSVSTAALILAAILSLDSCGSKSSDKLLEDDPKEESSEKSKGSDDSEESEEAEVHAPYKADVANAEKGKAMYATTCAPCHGKVGKGDGPGAANLNPKPRDHSKGEYMNTLTDDHIGTVIKKGGSQFGFPNMPAMPQLKDDEINALIAHVRTLSK